MEVSLLLDGELVEAVAEVLRRFAPDGVVIESTGVSSSPDDSEGHAVGLLRVCAYLPVDSDLEEKRRKLEEALWYLGRIRSLPEAQYRLIQDQDWSEAWKAALPADPHRRAPGDRAGLAGVARPGAHSHPLSTRVWLLARALTPPPSYAWSCWKPACHSLSRKKPMSSMSAAAQASCLSPPSSWGRAAAVAVDIDPQAISVTQENAALNGVAAGLEIGVGSVAELRDGAFSIRQAQLVLANILALVIIQLLDAGLAELLAPEGVAIFSGILVEQEQEVITALEKAGLSLAGRRQSGDWVALQVARN